MMVAEVHPLEMIPILPIVSIVIYAKAKIRP